MKTLLEVKSLTKRYDKRSPAGITSVSFDLNPGECVSLIGPSGSGKSTTLNIIKENLKADDGEILFNGKSIAYVAQVNLLDPKLSIFKNIEKEVHYIEDEEKRINQVRSTMQILELTSEIDRYPHEISGGQLQRVVMAKALVHNPDLIMMDEPFAHLDARLRFELMQELFSLFKDKQIAVLWVTHEIHEALAFSNRVIVLNQGKVQQIGNPEAIYQTPANMFVASFFGNVNLVAGKFISKTGDEIIVKAFEREVVLRLPDNFQAKEHNDVLLVVRPESILLEEDGQHKANVNQVQFYGPYYLIELKKQDQLFWAQVPNDTKLKIGQKVRFNIDYNKVYCLDEI